MLAQFYHPQSLSNEVPDTVKIAYYKTAHAKALLNLVEARGEKQSANLLREEFTKYSEQLRQAHLTVPDVILMVPVSYNRQEKFWYTTSLDDEYRIYRAGKARQWYVAIEIETIFEEKDFFEVGRFNALWRARQWIAMRTAPPANLPSLG
jgi:hypothetical protein